VTESRVHPVLSVEAGTDREENDSGRSRRRRRQLAAAAVVVLALGATAGVNLLPRAPGEPPVTIAAAMLPVAAPSCSVKPVEHDATDVIIFLAPDATDRQRSALDSELHRDTRVDTALFESREQAYQRFRTRWASNPDLVAAVGVEQLPESFRLRLVNASRYAAFRAEYAVQYGVQNVIGRVCPASAPVGGPSWCCGTPRTTASTPWPRSWASPPQWSRCATPGPWSASAPCWARIQL
jgi:FtsX extracellular domain